MQRDRDTKLLLDVWLLAQSVGRWMQSKLAQVGISADEMALCSLVHAVRGGSPTGLADLTGSPLSTTTSMIARLQRAGILEAEVDPSDRRAKRVCLTSSGEALLADGQAAFAPAYRSLVESLSVPVEQIGSALNDLESAVRADLGLTPRPDLMTGSSLTADPAILSAAQQTEVRNYIAWIRYRDRDAKEGTAQ